MMKTDTNVAKIILQQLHTCPQKECLPLTAALGATNFLAIENGLQFKVKGDKGINRVVVKLNVNDYYDIEFWDIRVGHNFKCDKKHEEKDIGVENLVDTIWRNVVIV